MTLHGSSFLQATSCLFTMQELLVTRSNRVRRGWAIAIETTARRSPEAVRARFEPSASPELGITTRSGCIDRGVEAVSTSRAGESPSASF